MVYRLRTDYGIGGIIGGAGMGLARFVGDGVFCDCFFFFFL